jgi:Asp-tRNA(Asn)/Glu-tRNA(Gln) amidotransferase A subunit family amidase
MKGEGLTTRSGLKLKTLEMERVELPAIKLSKEMKRRANVKKEIAKKSWKKQTDKKYSGFERLERDFLKHVYHNAGEMTAIWKNFEMAFHQIDKLLMFQKCVEGKSIILM